jgi:hypothetical protein
VKIKNLNEGSMDSFYQFFNYVSAYRFRLRSLLAVGIVLFCYLNIFGQLHITSSGTFLGLLPADQAAFQNQGAIIEPGVTFTIDFGLSMSPGKQILVEVGNTTTPGGVLIVQDKITSNSTWEGIVVQGDPTKQHYNQYPNPSIQDDPNAFYGVLNPIHGIVKLNGNTIIENAKHGVQVLDRGIVEALDPDALFDGSPKAGPKFINCKEGIFITNSNVSVSAIRLMNVDFEWTTLSVHGGSDYHGYLHIFLHNGVKDIYLGGCTFTNSDQNNYGTHAFNWGRGVGILSETITSLNTLYMGQSGNVFHQNGFTECMEIKVENRYSQIETGTMSNLSYGIYNTGLFIDFVEMVCDR